MARRPTHLPTKDEIVAFIRENPSRVGKREIARAFNIKGGDRIHLKAMLRELEQAGILVRSEGKRLASPGDLPELCILEITGLDADGEVVATPAEWTGPDDPPRIYLDAMRREAPGVGDRILARLRRQDDGSYAGSLVRTLGAAEKRVVGVFERLGDGSGRIRPADKRNKTELIVPSRDTAGAKSGDVVLVQPHPAPRFGPIRARVVEKIGRETDAGVVSLIAAHAHALPMTFSKAALEEAASCKPAQRGHRADLRELPLVTIDGADARDFDDAVFAEPDPDQEGGWRIVVAIADVSWYVRPGSALDRAAQERGTSAYFPDRVIPMLPEALSNDLCSLRPNRDRACVVAHIWIDGSGHIRKHRFERALIRSLARLTYEEVQAARDGHADGKTRPLMEQVIEPLYGAYAALAKARDARHTLDIDVPERVIEMDKAGNVTRISRRTRLDSHKLIEEFMIAANVAAAEALERRKTPCMYRIHDTPDPAKVVALADFVATLGLRFAKGQVVRPAQFNRLLDQARGTPHWDLVNDLILRTQAQALYAPDNIGHYGLALQRYAHFTSPIRRYADVLVHRGLVAAYDMGDGGLTEMEIARFEELGELISNHERRAVAAERDAGDRYLAGFLAERTGSRFDGRVSGVTRAGLFITLDETGASGLAPMSMLPRDFYIHDVEHQRLVGRASGAVFRMGHRVRVELVEAERITGSLILRVLEALDGGGEDETPSHRPPAHPGRPQARHWQGPGRKAPGGRPSPHRRRGR